jgi:hypothetical protein
MAVRIARRPGVELEAAPALTLGLRTHTEALSLSYAPRFVLRDVDLRPVFEALHGLSLAASTRDRRTTLSALAEASYGTTTTTALTLAAPASAEAAAAQSIPDGGTIAYAASRVGAGVTHAVTRRLALRAFGEGQMSGGANDSGRALIPQQMGPPADPRRGRRADAPRSRGHGPGGLVCVVLDGRRGGGGRARRDLPARVEPAHDDVARRGPRGHVEPAHGRRRGDTRSLPDGRGGGSTGALRASGSRRASRSLSVR